MATIVETPLVLNHLKNDPNIPELKTQFLLVGGLGRCCQLENRLRASVDQNGSHCEMHRKATNMAAAQGETECLQLIAGLHNRGCSARPDDVGTDLQ